MYLTQDRRPDFWISNRDHRQRPIDPALIRAAEDVWPRAYQMIRDALRDGSGAAEFLERVIHGIAEAQRRGRLPELYSPRSFVLTRLYQRLINEVRRNGRISYVGTLLDLEKVYGGREVKHGVVEAIYRDILIAQLMALMDEDSRRLMVLRLMEYRWSEIGRSLGLRTGTVRERFRTALKRLRERLSTNSPTNGPEEHDGETGEIS